MTLVDILGRPQRVLYNGVPEANRTESVRIDGSGLSSGIYIVRLAGDGFVSSQRITLLK